MNRIIALALFLVVVSGDGRVAPARANGDSPEARRATQALNLLEAQGCAAGLPD